MCVKIANNEMNAFAVVFSTAINEPCYVYNGIQVIFGGLYITRTRRFGVKFTKSKQTTSRLTYFSVRSTVE